MSHEGEPSGSNRAERMAGTLTRYIETSQPGSVASILDPHQRIILQAVADSWRTHQKGHIKEPTGGGKTIIQAALIQAAYTAEPGAKTLVVVPRKQLLHQVSEEFAERIPDITVTPYYGDRKDVSGAVNVTTYPSLLLGLARGDIDPDDYNLVLYDEAHHLLSERRTEASTVFVDALHVGLTATPGHGKNHHVQDVLERQISTRSIREAVEANRLSSFSVFIMTTGISLDEVKVRGNGHKEFDEVSLQKAVNVAARNQAAVDLYQQTFAGKQTISYCAGVDHARALADLFNYHGVKAAAVSGRQSTAVQQETIERYKAGEIQVICNADLLIEGFDDPKTSVILNLRPTLSPRLAEQRGGRGLRKDPDDRGKYAIIVDFIDEVKGKNQPISFAQVAEAAQIVNTWYQGGSGEYVGNLQPVILDLKKTRFITDSSEVMWAIDEINGVEHEVESGWKTLRRISAESGIPLNILGGLLSERESQFRQHHQEDVKDFVSPLGNVLQHYHYGATLTLLNDALICMGYEAEPSGKGNEREYFYRSRQYQALTPQGRRYGEKLNRLIDAEDLIGYAYEIFQKWLEVDEARAEAKRKLLLGPLSPNDEIVGHWLVKDLQPRIEAYKEKVRKADGTLIPLNKTLPDGKGLFMQVRYFDIPESEKDENVDVTLWDKKDRDEFGTKRMLVVDVYAGIDKDSLTPIAHSDWRETSIDGVSCATNADKNLHWEIIPKTTYEQEAQTKWTRILGGFSSRVDKDYYRLGIGTLMLATAGVALEAKGFTWFEAGALSSAAKRVYRKFGLSVDAYQSETGAHAIETLTQNPQTNLTIALFSVD